MVKDNFETETAAFWYNAPEVKSGEVRPEDIQTEVFFFPSAQVAEIEGTLHQHPAPAPVPLQGGRPAGRLPLRHLVHLPARQAAEEALRRQHRCRATRASRTWSGTTSPTRTSAERADHGRARRAARSCSEINGYYTGDPRGTSRASASSRTTARPPARPGSTAACYPGAGPATSPAQRAARSAGQRRARSSSWGFAWPANRRILYNRASADRTAQPWSERKKWVWWDGAQQLDRLRRARLRARPRRPTRRPKPDAHRAGRAARAPTRSS